MTDSQVIISSRYRLLEQIGRGGMGTVWRARDEVLGRDVAVKEVVPSPDLSSLEREIFTLRTLREARAAGRIGHPGVATVYDVIEENGRPWIVMQLVDSRTLGAVVREDGPLPPRRVAEIALDVLGALVAAHRVGVLHRDVKPDNVLIARNGRAVLTDFGIAMLEGDSSVTRTGALIGTPAFIAPERASGGPAEFASDMWSLGVTMYMAVEGRSPFERAHPLATLSAVMHQDPPPMLSAGPLAPAVFALLHKDPAQRMTAEELQIHLQAILSGAEPQSTAPVALPAGTVPQPRSESGVLPVAAAAAVPGAEATPSPESLGEPPGHAAGGPPRRRLSGGVLVAAALAATLASGAFAWVNVAGPGSDTVRQTIPASVPVKKKAPEKAKPSESPAAKEPARTDGGVRDGGGTGRSATPPSAWPRQGGDARRDGKDGKDRAEDTPAPEPDGKPSKDPGKGADKAGEKPEKNSGEKPKDQGKAPEDSGEGTSPESDGGTAEEDTRNQGENQGGESVDPYSEPNASGGKAPRTAKDTGNITVLADGSV
ncbi:serine/threonine-protein kinase [Streptosporangium sp. NPDC048047]|uniref:serine/threonine-protein kinase n=1 Tax=Streptosporangium sp. NPDC048047 TaxID=3155748 RepID=UPI003436102F